MGIYEKQIVPIKISQLAQHVARMKHITLDDALVYIYVNPLYNELYNEGAKWWYLSTEALYQELEIRRQRQTKVLQIPAFEFYTYCLENYAISKHISGLKAWALFKETGADNYIIQNYDLLHTQGIEYLVDDIHKYITSRIQ